MAAGLGFKDFVTGEVLTSGDVDGYLMQGVWVFADAAARTAAVTSPQEGNMSYLKDTNSTEYYSGSAWVAVGSIAGGVNLLLNSNFALNQRAYVSAANLASGSYGFDRWKSNFTNTTLTFTASTQGQSLTINSGGGLQQVIEQGLVPAGTYTLSWTGTATGRVYNSGGTPPSYAASPVTFTADGAANVVVEFTASGGTKTLSKVQFNAGTATTWALATPTLATELAACQRYYWRQSCDGTILEALYGIGIAYSTTATVLPIKHPVTMRVAATSIEFSTLQLTDFVTSTSISTLTLSSAMNNPTNAAVVGGVASGLTQYRTYELRGAGSASAYLGFSAEL
jgi:hypothetical protein